MNDKHRTIRVLGKEWRFFEYRGVPELFNTAREVCKNDPDSLIYPNTMSHWHGRAFKGWDDFCSSAYSPWKEGIETVESMRKEIETNVPSPVSRKRKRRLSEDQGDVEIDRVLNGDDYCYSEVRREDTHGSNIVTFITQINALAERSVEEMFWRTAVGLVLVDLLEESGYRCEVIGTSLSMLTHRRGVRNTFTVLRLKEADDHFDLTYLVNGLSPYCFRIGVLGSYHVVRGNVSIPGYGRSDHSQLPPETLAEIGIDNSNVIQMPSAFDKQSAIEECNKIISSIGTNR